MKNKNNKIYKVDIFLNLFCLYQLKRYADENEDLVELNNQIMSLAKKYGFTDLFNEEEFVVSHERVERMFSSVTKALFLRNQRNYYSRFTDILTVLLANNFLPQGNNIISYITESLDKENQMQFLTNFKKFAELGRPLITQEINKIRFYLRRKMSGTSTNQKIVTGK